ncbi:MAG: hypothetical protein ACJ0RB_07050 [Candidatus Azotimanducaceae bacterium]
MSAEDPKNAVCEVVFFDIYQPKSACTIFSFLPYRDSGNRLFFIKISHNSPRNPQIFHQNIKLLRIRNKKLYRERLKAKNPARRFLKGEEYQFLEMDY